MAGVGGGGLTGAADNDGDRMVANMAVGNAHFIAAKRQNPVNMIYPYKERRLENCLAY